MRWIDALKIYNQGKMWCVPRKGTPEHAEVKRIMAGGKPAEKKVEEKKEKKGLSLADIKAKGEAKKAEREAKVAEFMEKAKGKKKEKVKAFLMEMMKARKEKKEAESAMKPLDKVMKGIKNTDPKVYKKLQDKLSFAIAMAQQGSNVKVYFDKVLGKLVKEMIEKLMPGKNADIMTKIIRLKILEMKPEEVEEKKERLFKPEDIAFALKMSEMNASIRRENNKPGHYKKKSFIDQMFHKSERSPFTIQAYFEDLPDEFVKSDLEKIFKTKGVYK